ncbi:hypothetical protein [Prochlorococcus marinus]|uniref:hypothetical protein n=1 Tax=Prochlorococcus marinus TaxID=1219 RepID=UPI0022B401D2|nr:hypothetical protein [Prochlorococcus marinus]
MLKERIQEVFEFTKSESPYRKANKGWINQDIFLDLSPTEDTNKQTNETANVTLFWSPINSLLSNIFIVIVICSILVFTSILFSKGRFNFDLYSNSVLTDNLKVEENKSLNISVINDIGSTNSKNKQTLETKDLDKISPLGDDLIKVDEKIINQKIDKQDSLIKENQTNKDIKISQNKKPKSNFI